MMLFQHSQITRLHLHRSSEHDCFSRRKKVMDAVFKDEGGWRARFIHMFERLQDQKRSKKK